MYYEVLIKLRDNFSQYEVYLLVAIAIYFVDVTNSLWKHANKDSNV